MDPSLKQLRCFIAAAEAGQISKAASNINASQSAVTSAIKSLEEIVKTTLLERHPDGVKLTFEGSLFLEHARHIVSAVEEAVLIPKRSQANTTGEFSLAVTYTVAGYFLPSHLRRFTQGFPNVKVNIIEAERETIEAGLVEGSFDLALILTSNIANQEDLSYETLLRSRRRLWVNAQHRFLDQETVSFRDIAPEPYIMLTVDEASNTTHRYWNQSPHRPNTIFRTSSVEAVRSMVSDGMGVAILSDMVYRPWSLEGRRVEVMTVSDTVPTMDVGIAWSNALPLGEPELAFLEFMRLNAASSKETTR